MKKYAFLLPLIVLIFALASCNKDNTTSNNKPVAATLNVLLTDAPGPYTAVNVDVQKVMINATTDENSGWIELNTTAGVYNLLDFTAGKSTLIATAPLNVPVIKQIRLVLGSNNTISIDGGAPVPLDTPSAQQSGLKLNVNQVLSDGVSYTAILDFDASKSIVSAGNSGKYILKPVINLSFEAFTGAISGTISPTTELCHVSATTSPTITTDSHNGIYLLSGVPAGTYTVTITPTTTTGTTTPTLVFKEVVIPNVVVKNGETTMVPQVTLPTN